MDMYQNPFIAFPGITPEEMGFLQQGTSEMNEEQKKIFFMVYSDKRKNPQDLLIFTLIAFVGVAGIQRFAIKQPGMALLYFFTGGLCLIGTIVDIINFKSLANEYNRQMAFESFQVAKMNA